MLLLLCKNCSTVLYELEHNMYKQSNFSSKQNLTIMYAYDYYCKLCHNIIGFGSWRICKKCLIKQNIIDIKNYIYYYDYMSTIYWDTCFYCGKKICHVSVLNKNNYVFKII